MDKFTLKNSSLVEILYMPLETKNIFCKKVKIMEN